MGRVRTAKTSAASRQNIKKAQISRVRTRASGRSLAIRDRNARPSRLLRFR